MVRNLVNKKHLASVESFTARAMRIVGARPALKGVPGNRNRRDFIQALRLLEAEGQVEVFQIGEFLPRMVRTHVSCPSETWEGVFGVPEDVEQYSLSPSRSAVHVWRQTCATGPVRCIGHLFERSSGVRWVVVVRVVLY
jgi:hypothetical protein